MNSLHDLAQITSRFKEREKRLPALFMGHGSPMNAIEDNAFTQTWQSLANLIDQPEAVLCISAHWLTQGTWVTAMNQPKTIHDFYGFPQELFNVDYPAPGSPDLANMTKSIIKSTEVQLDHEWGLDHGTWSIVKRMYPKAHIPVIQLSIDYHRPASWHYALAAELASLRKRGVLIIGSGNMIHNLRILNWKQPESGFDWAIELNETFKKLISERDHAALINFEKLGASARLAIPTPDHYFPLIYTLGMAGPTETPVIFNDKTVMGSVSMTSVQFG